MKCLSYLYLAIVAFFLGLAQPSVASLVLNLEGIIGTDTINWSASGSVTTSHDVATRTSSTGAAPIGSVWDTGFDNNIGDAIQNTFSGDPVASITNVPLGSGGISYRRNGTEFGIADALDFIATSTSGGDDIEIDMNGNTSYPELFIGDVVSWTGSGTLTLGGTNFENFFNTGSYSNSINGGFYTVNISAVPEPSTVISLSAMFGALICVAWRRRRSPVPEVS